MTEVLLPCPLCGGDETSYGYVAGGGMEWGTAGCEACDLQVTKGSEAEAIAAWNHRTAGQAELASEASRLHVLAKANNDLARRYAEQIQSLRGAAVLALELIEEIQDEEGFSPSVAIPAQALRAALAPLSQSKGEG